MPGSIVNICCALYFAVAYIYMSRTHPFPISPPPRPLPLLLLLARRFLKSLLSTILSILICLFLLLCILIYLLFLSLLYIQYNQLYNMRFIAGVLIYLLIITHILTKSIFLLMMQYQQTSRQMSDYICIVCIDYNVAVVAFLCCRAAVFVCVCVSVCMLELYCCVDGAGSRFEDIKTNDTEKITVYLNYL